MSRITEDESKIEQQSLKASLESKVKTLKESSIGGKDDVSYTYSQSPEPFTKNNDRSMSKSQQKYINDSQTLEQK